MYSSIQNKLENLMQDEETIFMKLEELHSIFMNFQNKCNEKEKLLSSLTQWNIDKNLIYETATSQINKSKTDK